MNTQRKLILLDAGHGGGDRGAFFRRKTDGGATHRTIREAELSEGIIERLKEKLIKNEGLLVKTSREAIGKSEDVPWDARARANEIAAYCLQIPVDFLLSLHVHSWNPETNKPGIIPWRVTVNYKGNAQDAIAMQKSLEACARDNVYRVEVKCADVPEKMEKFVSSGLGRYARSSSGAGASHGIETALRERAFLKDEHLALLGAGMRALVIEFALPGDGKDMRIFQERFWEYAAASMKEGIYGMLKI